MINCCGGGLGRRVAGRLLTQRMPLSPVGFHSQLESRGMKGSIPFPQHLFLGEGQING